MKTFSTLALLTLLTALTACETVVDVPEPAHTPQLALRYILAATPPDSATRAFFGHRQLYVSTSQRLYDTSPLQGRADATAQLLDDAGAVVEEFRPGRPFGYFGFGGGGGGGGGGSDTAGYYQPTRGFVPVPGRTYRLQVAAPGVETVESTLTLPAAPATILSARYTPRPGSDPYQTYGQLALSIQDDGASSDAYLAFARVVNAAGKPLPFSSVYRDNQGNGEPGSTDVRGAQLDLSYPGDLSGLNPYPDADVAGRAFPLAADVVISGYDPISGNPGLPPGAQLEITISRLTPDTYRFLLSLRRYYATDGNIFAEPAPLHSNVRPGFGVFGGAVDATVRLPIN